MSATTEKPGLFGLLAEFETTQQVYDAANLVRKEGFTKAEAYSPFPIDGLWEAIGHKRTMLPTLIFCGGLLGAVTAFILQTLTSGSHPDSLDPLLDGTVSTLTGNMLSFNYRMNIAGRPFFSWPAFIPPIFGMLLLNGYPQPHHPLFNNRKFDRASTDRFFICIEATDPTFDREATEHFLQGLKPLSVTEVPL